MHYLYTNSYDPGGEMRTWASRPARAGPVQGRGVLIVASQKIIPDAASTSVEMLRIVPGKANSSEGARTLTDPPTASRSISLSGPAKRTHRPSLPISLNSR